MNRPHVEISVCDAAGNWTPVGWTEPPKPQPAPIVTPKLVPPIPVGTICWVVLSTSGAGVRVRVKSIVGDKYRARRVNVDGVEFGPVRAAKREQIYPE